MGIEPGQRERMERMGFTQAPTETDYEFHERVTHELRRNRPMGYGTKRWYADRALGAHWFVKTVSIIDCADNPNIPRGQIHVDVWGPRWWPWRVPNRIVEKVSDTIARDMPINVTLIVEDGRP